MCLGNSGAAGRDGETYAFSGWRGIGSCHEGCNEDKEVHLESLVFQRVGNGVEMKWE